ncbi:MAG: cytidine deaminase [Bacilli bacterium]|jgi:cytidine deaminase|nr:cytidine deaminase [Bacilli bacterium]
MDRIWHSLYKEAKNRITSKAIPPFIEYGDNSCAILTSNNNIYTGTSINSNTSLKSTAERSAITNMLNNGETTIIRMLILNELEELIKPSPDCLDCLLELGTEFGNIEILLDAKDGTTAKLIDIMPAWWGTYRNKK